MQDEIQRAEGKGGRGHIERWGPIAEKRGPERTGQGLGEDRHEGGE